MLLIGAFVFSFPVVEGCADGRLKLNTDVLMNNGGDIGGTGDFPIRGQLFSSEMQEANQNLQMNEAQLLKRKRKLDFKEKSSESLNTKFLTKNLFQDYHPQVIASTENDETTGQLNLSIVGIVLGVFLIFLGILVGNQRVKRKRRRG